MTWAFHPQSELHQKFYNLKKEDMEKYYTGTDEWRKSIRVGSLVDVRVDVDTNKNNKARGWI